MGDRLVQCMVCGLRYLANLKSHQCPSCARMKERGVEMTDPMELVGRLELGDYRMDDAHWIVDENKLDDLISEAAACIRELVEWRIRDDRKAELRDFLIALFEEWGEEDWDEAAKQIATFLTDEEGLEKYREAYGLPLPPAPGAEA